MLPNHAMQHISNVYNTLTLFITIFGLTIWYGIGQNWTDTEQMYIPFFVACISIMLIFVTQFPYLFACIVAVCTGLMGLPLIYLVLKIDPNLIIISVVLTLCIFVSISLVAFTRPIKNLFLVEAFLSSWLSLSIIMGIVCVVTNMEYFFAFRLYSSLILFLCYVLYDTQLMIERAIVKGRHITQHEVIFDSMSIFLDLVNIFIKILVILVKNAKKKN